MKDAVVPFIFDLMSVRGALVQLERAWQRIRQNHEYATPVQEILGHAAAAASLIAQSLKFDGSITLQISGSGPLGILVMQCTDGLDLRGMSTAGEVPDDATFSELVKGAHCAVTIDAGAMDRPYQGIVEINPASLAASFENYFAHSVQIQSHLVLVANASCCGGILLQQMPGTSTSDDDWARLGFLIKTLRKEDLVDGATPELLHRVFSEDDIRVFGSRPVRFQCRCSQSRVEDVLRFLGETETREALRQKGQVVVTCEYCGEVRTFDAVDVSRVFAAQVMPGSGVLH